MLTFGKDLSVVLEFRVKGGIVKPEKRIVVGREMSHNVQVQLSLLSLATIEGVCMFALVLFVEMRNDLHLLRQDISLLTALKHLHLCLLSVVLEHDVFELLQRVGSDQAGDIVEPHPDHSVAQKVE